ncbi:hypothetical protein VNI00_000708 [Paramarasmius palmivorus]|uniref:Uncharacterized protein n=1 Tax=Paramarasmius palmivorus TaxID=297713 RepID=A0AAW0EBS1_9AGAR
MFVQVWWTDGAGELVPYSTHRRHIKKDTDNLQAISTSTSHIIPNLSSYHGNSLLYLLQQQPRRRRKRVLQPTEPDFDYGCYDHGDAGEDSGELSGRISQELPGNAEDPATSLENQEQVDPGSIADMDRDSG